MACKRCEERRKWMADWKKRTGISSSAKALLALYKERNGGRSGVPEAGDQSADGTASGNGEDAFRVEPDEKPVG